MKNSISHFGKVLDKTSQKQINGGYSSSRDGCYTYPDASVNCISPWVVIHGCYTCKVAAN